MTFNVNLVREQFPSLAQQIDHGGNPIFFDNPAGTQVSKAVISAVTDYYLRMNANAGGKFATSQRNDAMMSAAREAVADFLNANSSSEIVFGQNMTTLNFGLSRALAKTLQPGDEIVVTKMDHDANVAPWLLIADDYDLVIRRVDILDHNCTLDMGSFEAALTDRTQIVATVHASNAVGTINPVQQIGEMAHAAGALYVIDAVQSAPHIPIDVQAIGCDFLLCSAYKFFGPHIGVMWGRYELLADLPVYKVRPSRNKPPDRWETGTLSFETINGVAAAIDYLAWVGKQFGDGAFTNYSGRRLALKQGMVAIQQYEQQLVHRLIQGLQQLPGIHISGITNPDQFDFRVPTVAIVVDGYTADEVAAYFADNHMYVWSGNYYAVEIMERLGHSEHGMVRIGLAHYNTTDEIDTFLNVLNKMS